MLDSLKKQIANFLLMFASCLVAFFLAETMVIAYRVLKHGQVGRNELITERRELRDDIVGGVGNRFENRLVLHPLFGYTYNPRDEGTNNFGFPSKYNISFGQCGYSIENDSSSDPLVIGIFGGSFAQLTGNQSEYLEEKLKDVFPDKQPIVMNFAIGGHALPQSAFIYLYFRELFDIVIFIDGVNELWNYVENNAAGFPPEYAKASHYTYKISRQELTPLQFEHTSRIIASKRKIDTITQLSLLPIFRQSVLVHYIWKRLQAYWSRTISEESSAIIKSYRADKKFFNAEDDTILDYAARQWRRYHVLVDHASLMEGALAIHLFQPNPFVPNSKVLTQEEHYIVTNSNRIEQYIVKGYPKIQGEIRKLHEQGLIVEDLTNIFRSIKTTIWIDPTHANSQGSRIIMDRIAAIIKANKNSNPLNSKAGLSLRGCSKQRSFR